MKNWNDNENRKSAMRKTLSIATALVLVVQVFGIPGVKFSDRDLTPYEKAMAALPGQLLNNMLLTSQGCDWYSFGKSSDNNRIAPDECGLSGSSVLKKWEFSTGMSITGSPVFVDNSVYIGSMDGYMYCIDFVTGSQLWKTKLGNPIDMSTPLVYDNKVFVGAGSVMYSLDCVSGSINWQFSTGNFISNAGQVYNNKIYFSSNDWNIYCLDAESGIKIWSYYYNGNLINSSSPTIINSNVYVSSGNRLLCLDAEKGLKQWDYITNDHVGSSPVVVNNKVYFGSYDNNMYCIDAITGSKVWSYKTGSWILSSASVYKNKVYFGSEQDGVYCLEAESGTLVWKFSTYKNIYSSPAISNDKVYIGSWDNNLYCLNASSGVQEWKFQTGSTVSGSPIIVNSNVIFGSGDHKLYCLEDVKNQPTTNQWLNAADVPLTSTNGNVSNNSGSAYGSSLVIDKNSGHPCLVWSDTSSGNSEIFFAKWNGSSWVNANGATLNSTNGNVSNNTGSSFKPSIVLDPKTSYPCIVWTDSSTGNYEIYLTKWNGTSWVNANGVALNSTNGNVSNNTKDSLYPTLAIDDSGMPCVTWSDYAPGNYEIYYTKWNGTSWVNVNGATFNSTNGNISNNTGGSYYPSLALDPSTGYPCIAWSDTTPGNYEIYYTKWNGNSWVNVNGVTLNGTNGNVSNNTGSSYYPSLSLDSYSNPYLVWSDSSNVSEELFYCKWGGSSWLCANNAIFTGKNANIYKSYNNRSSLYAAIKVEDDTAHVYWSDYLRLSTPSFGDVGWGSGILSHGFKGNENILLSVYYYLSTSFVKISDGEITNLKGEMFNGSNANVIEKKQISGSVDSFRETSIDVLNGNPSIAWVDYIGSNSELLYAHAYTNSSKSSVTGIKEFKKEVDTNADGIFDDDNKPVKPGQTIAYKIKLGFNKGMKSIAWIVDKIPYEATYVRGCQPNNQVYYSFPAKNWTFKQNVSGEPEENASKGTFIIWKADPINGENQTFVFKVKAATQSQIPMSLKNDGIFSNAYAMSTYSGVKSEPAGLLIPDTSSAMFTNTMYNRLESTDEKLEILDPIDNEEWPVSTGVRVQWNYTGDAINKVTNQRKVIKFEVATISGLVIASEYYDIFCDNMVGTLPLTYAKWDDIVPLLGDVNAILNVSIDGIKVKSVNIKLARHGVLNYASWADSFSSVKGRHPLIFIHGINLENQSTSKSEEQVFDALLKTFGNDQNNIFKYFKPYVFHYDSGDFMDSFCDYENATAYQDPPRAPKILKGIEAAGFDLKKEVEQAYSNEPSTFNNSNGMFFVSHSMGGLVTRSFMAEKWSSKDRYFGLDVTRVVTLGTPHHGSPAASLSVGTRNILPSQFTNDLSWDDYDISLADEKAPNVFLKNLNCIPTYIGKAWGIQQSKPTTNCKVNYSNKIVGLAGQIAIKGSDGKPWIDDTNELVLGIGHVANSYIKDPQQIPLFGRDFWLKFGIRIGVIIGYALKASGKLDKLKNLFEYIVDFDDKSTTKIQVKDLKPFTKNYPENDGIVPVESALYEDVLSPLYNKQLFKSQWSPFPVFYNHGSICSESDVIAYVAHSICSPILKVSPSKIRPGDIFTIEGKSFGTQQWDSNIFLGKSRSVASSNPVVMSNIQLPTEIPIKVISWSNEEIVCQMPTDASLSSVNILNNVGESSEYQICLRTGSNGIVSPVTPINEENPETGAPTWDGKIDIKTKEDRVSLSIWPSKSQLVKGENVEFTIKAKNTGTSELTNVDIITNIPRELEFVSSTIKGVMGKNKLRIQLSKLMPNETAMFKVLCRLSSDVMVPEESGLWLLITANLTSINKIDTSASSLIRYFTRKPSENLSMNIIWKGVNTKTNEAKVGNPIALTIDVNGGSMPYYITINWGDGEKIDKKTWNKMLDPKPVIDHTFSHQGEVIVIVTCIDAYGKTTSTQRLLNIR